jgi:hypothetical protein
VCITTENISGICCDLGGVCLQFDGLQVCQLCCGFKHKWKELTQETFVSSVGPDKQRSNDIPVFHPLDPNMYCNSILIEIFALS